MAMPAQQGRLQIGGDRTSGQDVRTQNVTAVSAIANIVKTSLGPVGLDKVRGSAAKRAPCTLVCVCCCRCFALLTHKPTSALSFHHPFIDAGG